MLTQNEDPNIAAAKSGNRQTALACLGNPLGHSVFSCGYFDLATYWLKHLGINTCLLLLHAKTKNHIYLSSCPRGRKKTSQAASKQPPPSAFGLGMVQQRGSSALRSEMQQANQMRRMVFMHLHSMFYVGACFAEGTLLGWKGNYKENNTFGGLPSILTHIISFG